MNVSRDLYPFDHHYLDRDGLRLHYLDEGSGDATPVLMVHGNPTWSFYYREVVKELRTDRRCIVPDHIGCGFSDKPGDDQYNYTLQSRVDDLTRLVDTLGLTQVDLIVHDWGGMIGSTWAVQNPEKVRRMVVLNTGAFLNPKGKRIPPQLRLARDSKLGAFLVRGFNAFSRGATLTCTTRKKLSKEVIDGYVAPYNSWQNRIATLRFVQDIPLGPKDEAYSVVAATDAALHTLADKPMMIRWGMKDFVFDVAFLEEWERRFPDADVQRFEDSGHYILEDASEIIVPQIRRFLGASE